MKTKAEEKSHIQNGVYSLMLIHKIPNTRQNSYTIHKYFTQIVMVTLQAKRYMQGVLRLAFKALYHLIHPLNPCLSCSEGHFGGSALKNVVSSQHTLKRHCTVTAMATEPGSTLLHFLYTIKSVEYFPQL